MIYAKIGIPVKNQNSLFISADSQIQLANATFHFKNRKNLFWGVSNYNFTLDLLLIVPHIYLNKTLLLEQIKQ